MGAEEIIAESVVAILVAIIGFVAGLFVEKKRHSLEIQTIGLNLSVDAYHELLASYFDLTVATGKLVGSKKEVEERAKLSTAMMDALKKFSKASCNPIISSDSVVIKSREISNKHVATVEIQSLALTNGDNSAYGVLSDAQLKLVEDSNNLRDYISAKYSAILPNEFKKDEIRKKRIDFITNSFYTPFVMRFKNDR